MKKIHLICNAHIDPVWQWTWDEGISATIATFKSAADLADRFDYIFCHNESLLYEAIEEYAPELFAKIKKLVKLGKWVITGGWYVQPDCNLPCGESFVRQIKMGQDYFVKKFGIRPSIATNYDSFGHSVGLVQILAKSGYKGYIATRPWAEQFSYPGRFFNWVAPDGSKLIFSNPHGGYGTFLGKSLEKIQNCLPQMEDVDYILWGVGNHGGGPSAKDLQDINSFSQDGVQLVHSTPERLFADEIKISGEVKQSLITSMPGCYSSMAKIKQAHRETENMLYSTEKMLSAAISAGYKINLDRLVEAQKRMLLAEFHDILPGTSTIDGEAEGLELLSTSRKIIKDYRSGAFLYLVMGEDRAEPNTYPIYVFNYMPYEVTCPVEVEFSMADANWDDKYINIPHLYKDGQEIPCQQIKEDGTIGIDWRKRIVFNATLNPLTITKFVATVEKIDNTKKPNFDRANLGEYIKNSLLLGETQLQLLDDTADPWGMSTDEQLAMGKNPTDFVEMSQKQVQEFCAVDTPLSPVHIIEDGDVLTAIQSMSTCNNTNAVVEYRFYKEQPYVDIKVTAEFTEKNKLLRLKMPCPQGVCVGDGPYLVEEKVGKGEQNFQKWIGVKSGEEVFAVINDGVHSGKVENGYLYLTLLRATGYLFHPIDDRQVYPKDRYLPRIDTGRYTFNLRVFKGTQKQVCMQADLFNAKPYALNVFPIASGKKVPTIKTNKPVSMGAMYIDKGVLTARFYNPQNLEDSFELFVGKDSCTITMAPYSIVTVTKDKKGFKVYDKTIPY